MLVAGALGLPLTAMAQPAPSAKPTLQCQLQVPRQLSVGEPIMLSMTLTNPGPQALRVLVWNTPFEGAWWGPSVQLRHNGRALPYRGPSAKRAQPTADEYVLIPSQGSREASLDLALPFAMTTAGRYELRPKFVLHDVQPESAPTRAERVMVTLACPTLSFALAPKRS